MEEPMTNETRERLKALAARLEAGASNLETLSSTGVVRAQETPAATQQIRGWIAAIEEVLGARETDNTRS
jgi:hypothetical protein